MALQFLQSFGFQAVSVPGLTSLKNVAGWTLMGYMRPFSLATRVLIDVSGGSGTNTRAAIQINGSGQMTVQARALDGDSLQTVSAPASTVAAGELFHFAGVCDYVSKTLQVYKNGIQVGNGTAAGFGAAASSNTTSNACNIGADAGSASGFMDGIIDDPRIYNRVLGPAEVLTISSLWGQDKLLDSLTNRYIFNEFPDNFSVSGPGIYVDYGSNQRNGDANGAIFVPSLIRFRQGKGRQAVGANW
jgi:hypothetical protein